MARRVMFLERWRGAVVAIRAMNLRLLLGRMAALGAFLFATACESSAPTPSGPSQDAGRDGSVILSEASFPDGGVCTVLGPVEVRTCAIAASDYTPRDPASKGTRLPLCISDDNTYHPINPDVPSNSRIAAVEQLGKLLKFDGSGVPTPNDFVQARILYTQPEGLDSRVQRREDIHFPEATVGGVVKACRDMTAAERAPFADRCAGPEKLIPLINDALVKGAAGTTPTLQAARIEAAMVWFMWLSFYKESQGCFGDPGQCDSTSSYWGGQQDVNAPPLGYGRMIRAYSEESYRRGWDAVLAIRCAYDYTVAQPAALDLAAVKEKARDQIDRMNNHALAIFVRSKVSVLPCDAPYEAVRLLGPVLDVVARAKDPAKADKLKAEFAKSAVQIDRDMVLSMLDDLFGCP